MTPKYFVLRAIKMVPVILGMTMLVFLMIHLVPGDPARTMLGPRAPESAVIELRHKWGLDRPLTVQFAQFIGRLMRGNLGESLSYGIPVADLIAQRLGPTFLLVTAAAILVVLITVPAATLAAVKVNQIPDYIVRAIPLVGLGMPAFWLGIIMILVLAIGTGWFPVGGYGETFLEHLHSILLPGLTVAISISPFTIRSLRASMLEVMDADYISTARSKGLTEARVLIGHTLRNAVIPTVTVLGVNIGWLVGNSLVIEKVFAIPGIGSLMIDAVLDRDFPVVQSLALIFGFLVMFVNLTADFVRASLDPRVRLG